MVNKLIFSAKMNTILINQDFNYCNFLIHFWYPFHQMDVKNGITNAFDRHI